MRVALIAGPAAQMLSVVVDEPSDECTNCQRSYDAPWHDANSDGKCCSVKGFARAVLNNVDHATLFSLSDNAQAGSRAVVHVPMSADNVRTVRTLAACAAAKLDVFPSSTARIDQSSAGWSACEDGNGQREPPLVAVLANERTHVPLGMIRMEREYASDSGRLRGGTRVILRMRGLQPNTTHAVHVHQFGDISGGCGTAGPHWNPDGAPHGSAHDARGARHVGDLGNVLADASGNAHLDIVVKDLPLFGARGVAGRAVVVHASPDDLGRGSAEDSLTTGNAGSRIACGVLGIAK